MTAPEKVDVAIIGAGPVGLTLANILGKLGRSVVVLEKQHEGYALPRAITFDDEIMRLFQGIGLEDEVLQVTEVGADAQFVDAEGNVLVRWERPQEITPNGWHVNYRFYQPTLEATLRAGLDRFDEVSLLWGREVTSIDQHADGVVVGCSDGSKVDAAFVVGCDGGRSFTRRHIGGGNEDLGFHEPWLIVDLKNHAPEQNPDRKTTHYCGTARMGSKVFAGIHRKRWEFRLNADDDPQTIGDHDNVWRILAPFIDLAVARIERTAVYTFHSLIAHNWRRDRVFIAGDAAHQTPPFMGQGMCTGLRDAANLGWKLDMVLAGQGPAGLLNTYESERKPHARAYIDLAMNMGAVINHTAQKLTSPAATDTDDGAQHMRLIRPTLGPGLAAGDAEGRGALFPQVTLSDGRRLDDALGLAPAIICARNPDDGAPDQLPLLVDAALEPMIGTDEAVLIRPDRAILGRAALADITPLLPENWRAEV